MNDSTLIPVITQADVDALLAHLKELREQIAASREVLAPLEANLALAYDEFQTIVGQLRRQTFYFQAEISTLRARIDGFDLGQNEGQGADDKVFVTTINTQTGDKPSAVDSEAIEKDHLLEYIFRVLDPTINDEDAELIATLQGLCNNPVARLADLLEKLPWGPAWVVRSRQETLVDQHQRLLGWERALVTQLDSLKRAAGRLEKDSRYGLWQQRQKGPAAWQSFLQDAVEQQGEVNDKLAADLEELRKKWTQRASGNEHSA